MASKMEKTTGSRLVQMQARFQQKQLQEREMKIASLYEAQQARALDRVRHSPSIGASKPKPPEEPSLPVNPGKVRQMFEERRTKKGIDKSYPLQPIHNNDRKKPATNGISRTEGISRTDGLSRANGVSKTSVHNNGPSKTSIISNTSRISEKRKQTVTSTNKVINVRKTQQKTEVQVNGSGDLNHNQEFDMNKNFKNTVSKSKGDLIPAIDALDRVDGNYLIENETPPPALAPSTPPVDDVPKRPPRRNTPIKEVQQGKSSPHQRPVAPPRKTNGDNSELKRGKFKAARGGTSPLNTARRLPRPCVQTQPTPTQGQNTTKARPALSGARVGGSPGGGPVLSARKTSASAVGAPAAPTGEPCSVCGRRFAPDRLQRHEEICRKASTKKRKPFDVLKHRLAGTEAEQYVNKLKKKGGAVSTTEIKTLNSNWRQKHQDFIKAIRAAKQVQAHLDKGGKLSDLPPPPRSENPDYVECPHCHRRFNQSAAERHIPKCASFQFNKTKGPPKAAPSKGRR